MAPGSIRFWLLCLALLLAGCRPDIGDACTLHSDCSVTGDRLCDPTFRGGYCTIFNCEPGKCPDEAVCVAYGLVLGSDPICRDPEGSLRFERTFCMKKCSADSDCRTDDGYVCRDLGKPNPWNAQVVERGSSTTKVCTMPDGVGATPPAPPHSTEVCSPPLDASFPPLPDGPPAGTGGAGGSGGAPDASAGGGRDGSAGDGAAPDARGSGGTDGGRRDGGPRDAGRTDAADAQGDR